MGKAAARPGSPGSADRPESPAPVWSLPDHAVDPGPRL
ncbi:hypothetical protein DVDV_1976 [Desulfovibrio sp. DV]|nr:hypothetical protein DVDV_1976 [Desulfovibrio sp. DV]